MDAQTHSNRFPLTLALLALLLLACATTVRALPAATTAQTLRVGPERALTRPSEAARLARPGDTVEIDAGVYENDHATWQQDDLVIRAVGGTAHLAFSGNIPNGKAIWIVAGNNVLIENIEFSGATVRDSNGAGIRHERGNLTLRNTYFHHNEFSVLTGEDREASLVIDSSRFHHQKRPGRFSHGLYIGALKRFTLVGSHVTGTDRGHQVKSRARENHIRYNRIEDIPGGNSSRLVDLPNCGLSFVVGNDLHQADSTQNVDAIGYGAEGCDDRTEEERRLFVVNNTFVNEAWNGALVRNHAGGQVSVFNNLTYGRGRFLLGRGEKGNNYFANLGHRQRGSWLPPRRSRAIGGARELPSYDGTPLMPERVFASPAGTAAREVHGSLDAGSRESPL